MRTKSPATVDSAPSGSSPCHEARHVGPDSVDNEIAHVLRTTATTAPLDIASTTLTRTVAGFSIEIDIY
jgi:hypothetical protein